MLSCVYKDIRQQDWWGDDSGTKGHVPAPEVSVRSLDRERSVRCDVLSLCPLVLLVNAGRRQNNVWYRQCSDSRRLSACGAVRIN